MSAFAGDTLIEDGGTTITVSLNSISATALETEGLVLAVGSNGENAVMVATSDSVQVAPISPPDPEAEELVIWFDDQSARVFPEGVASIALIDFAGDYATTGHLGETAFAPPPGVLSESNFIHKWAIQMPDSLTSGDFTIEAWVRSSDASPPFGGVGVAEVSLVWIDDDDVNNGLYMGSLTGWSDVENPGTVEEQSEVSFSSEYGGDGMFAGQLFGTSIQGWKHLCYQRINGEDVFHYHGTRFNFTSGVESLPSPRPIPLGAELFVFAENQATSGVGLGQVKVSSSALYGTGTFTPPATAFYVA